MTRFIKYINENLGMKKNDEPKIINNIPKNNKSLGKKIIQDSKSFEYDSPLYVSNNIINPKNKKFISNEKRIKKINNYRFSEIQLKNKPKSKNENIINLWKQKMKMKLIGNKKLLFLLKK